MSTSQSHDFPDLILVNPAAGGGRAGRVAPALRAWAEKNGWRIELRMTKCAQDLAEQARAGVVEGRKRILVVGGDGTFQILLNAVGKYSDVVLGIIPAGGGNDLARALGLPTDPLRAAALLCAGEPCFLDAVQVRTADGVERLYAGGGGVGVDAEAVGYASTTYKNLPGRWRYLISALRAILGFRPLQIQVTMNSKEPQTLQANALVAAVLNTPSYGAGLRLAPDAKLDDGKLDLVVLEAHSFAGILGLFFSLARSGEIRSKRVRRYLVEQVRIETGRPGRFHGDGEILGSAPVEIKVVPGAARVLRPGGAS